MVATGSTSPVAISRATLAGGVEKGSSSEPQAPSGSTTASALRFPTSAAVLGPTSNIERAACSHRDIAFSLVVSAIDNLTCVKLLLISKNLLV